LKKLSALLILTFFLTQGITSAAISEILIATADETSQLENELDEANKKFKYKGKPIHPGCVEQFNASLADTGPPIIRAVDVKSCINSNEFAGDFKVNDDGYIIYEYGVEGENYFGYKYIGKASGGLHVLDTISSGGGTMVAKTIFLTRFGLENYKSFDNEGKINIEKRLIMKFIGQIIRGDRDVGKVELKDNEIFLGESQYRKKMEVIHLD
jgi:hypothetical protein